MKELYKDTKDQKAGELFNTFGLPWGFLSIYVSYLFEWKEWSNKTGNVARSVSLQRERKFFSFYFHYRYIIFFSPLHFLRIIIKYPNKKINK